MNAAKSAGLPRVPASFFGIVLGVVGLGNSWRVATQVWHVPAVIGANIVLGLIGLGNLRLIVQGRLLPKAPAAAPPPNTLPGMPGLEGR